MTDLLAQYPEAQKYLDQTPGLRTTAEKLERGGSEFILVRQVSEFEGGEVLLEISGDKVMPVLADNVIDVDRRHTHFETTARHADACRPSPDEDHRKVAELSRELVNRFSSAEGPDHGNLACVWAVRHIAHRALRRWITRTDGTAVFDPELKACMGDTLREDQVPGGGIVISPTQERPNGSRNIGHVGLLGPATTPSGNRLIYSNSSARARWEQNFTVASWNRRYAETKGLPVHYYRLPLLGPGATS